MSTTLDEPHLRLEWARQRAGYASKAVFAKAVGLSEVTYRAYESGQNGFSRRAHEFGRKLGVSAGWLLEGGPAPDEPPPAPPDETDDDLPMVGIEHIDLAYGAGATFADGAVNVEVLQFPRVWVESITLSPPSQLTWTRARGDSMEPTIHDGDLVLLDRSQRAIKERDAMWAFTVGDTASIKRLRVKGQKVIILSDNKEVPDDEEPRDAVNVVARVVFVGKRK